MPLDVFWYDDMRYLSAYSKAYANRNEQLSYMTGVRVYEAVSCALHNAFAGNSAVPRKFSDKPNRHDAEAKTAATPVSNVATWAQRIKRLKGISKEA